MDKLSPCVAVQIRHGDAIPYVARVFRILGEKPLGSSLTGPRNYVQRLAFGELVAFDALGFHALDVSELERLHFNFVVHPGVKLEVSGFRQWPWSPDREELPLDRSAAERFSFLLEIERVRF